MKTHNKNTQEFIDYLNQKFVVRNSGPLSNWTKTGERSFMYKDAHDIIFVYVSDTNLIVVSDGDDVSEDGHETYRLFLNRFSECPIQERQSIFDHYIRRILGIL